MDPIDFGWPKVDQSFTPDWYEGSPIPAAGDLRMRNDGTMEHSDDEDDDLPGEAEAESSDSSGDEDEELNL